jgi:hypothetical protein
VLPQSSPATGRAITRLGGAAAAFSTLLIHVQKGVESDYQLVEFVMAVPVQLQVLHRDSDLLAPPWKSHTYSPASDKKPRGQRTAMRPMGNRRGSKVTSTTEWRRAKRLH